MNKYTHKQQYLMVKTKGILAHATIYLNLEDTMISEKSWLQRHKLL